MCDRKTSKKYTSRPSPPYPANQCSEGTRKKGNDTTYYVTESDKNGTLRWVKVTKSAPKKSPAAKKKAQKSPAAAKKKSAAAKKAQKSPAAKKKSGIKRTFTISCD